MFSRTFYDADDIGKEGIESSYDNHLSGTDGSKQVMQDRFGRIIKDIQEIVHIPYLLTLDA